MSVFRVQHFSDTHHAMNPTHATLCRMSQYEVDARIHTGDASYNVFEDDYSYLAPYDFMFVVGNHDFILQYGADHWVASGMDWSQQPSEWQVYFKFIEPTLARNPVVIRKGKTYWYRDYEEMGIRVIGVNGCLVGSAYEEECVWLRNVLSDSLASDLKVIVASHYPPYNVKAKPCCFTDEYCMPSLLSGSYFASLEFYPFIQVPYWYLCEFADKVLTVLGLLAGHEHGDGLFVGGNNVKFPILMVASVVIDSDWSNLSRSDDLDSAACPLFNQYEYDDVQNVLRVYRIGANGRRNGDLCKMAIWDYGVGDFVNFFSRR